MLYKVVILTFKFINEVIQCDHSNESCLAILATYFSCLIISDFKRLKRAFFASIVIISAFILLITILPFLIRAQYLNSTYFFMTIACKFSNWLFELKLDES